MAFLGQDFIPKAAQVSEASRAQNSGPSRPKPTLKPSFTRLQTERTTTSANESVSHHENVPRPLGLYMRQAKRPISSPGDDVFPPRKIQKIATHAPDEVMRPESNSEQ
jgi:hypothetical protein